MKSKPMKPAKRSMMRPISGLAVASVLAAGVMTAVPAAADPFDEDALPGDCVLSPAFNIYEKRSANSPYIDVEFNPDRFSSQTLDPDNDNYELRGAELVAHNLTDYDFYDVTVFSDNFVFSPGADFVTGSNNAPWDVTEERFETLDGLSWDGSDWEPRDPSTPGATATWRDSTHPVIIVEPNELGFSGLPDTAPAYKWDKIEGDSSSYWEQLVSMERPTEHDQGVQGYQWEQDLYISARVCMPTPVIDPIDNSSPSSFSGDGTREGNDIVLTNALGEASGAVVGNNLRWEVSFSGNASPSEGVVTVTETDMFGFEGTSEAEIPFEEASVGDLVWHDLNRNGIQDAGEPGIPDAVLEIANSSGDPVINSNGVVPATVTDSSGNYLFEDLPALTVGDFYKVTIDASSLPEGLVPTLEYQGDGTNDSSTGSAFSTTIATESDLDLDFGFYLPADLVVEKALTDPDSYIYPGDSVSFDITPSNEGPGDALAGWTVEDIAPAGFDITRLKGPGYNCDLNALICTANNVLPAGEDGASINVVGTLDPDFTGDLTNEAVVAVSEDDAPESDEDNNNSSAAFTVLAEGTTPPGDVDPEDPPGDVDPEDPPADNDPEDPSNDPKDPSTDPVDEDRNGDGNGDGNEDDKKTDDDKKRVTPTGNNNDRNLGDNRFRDSSQNLNNNDDVLAKTGVDEGFAPLVGLSSAFLLSGAGIVAGVRRKISA